MPQDFQFSPFGGRCPGSLPILTVLFLSCPGRARASTQNSELPLGTHIAGKGLDESVSSDLHDALQLPLSFSLRISKPSSCLREGVRGS